MALIRKSKVHSPYRLPDPPERKLEDMTSARHLAENGNMHHLKQHLGNAETTVVKSELFMALDRRGPDADFRIPDLVIAFDADPELYVENNGYVTSEQGKPPDFVLEIASPSTRAADNNVKRDFYARHGAGEYWRFDEDISPRSVKLAGDRLVDGAYVPIPIDELPNGNFQGYSSVLNLLLRWENRELVFIDPATEQRIATWEDQSERAAAAEARVRELLADRERAEARVRGLRADQERAEARVRELEAELDRRDRAD